VGSILPAAFSFLGRPVQAPIPGAVFLAHWWHRDNWLREIKKEEMEQ
jgi:hypothetical protein